MGLHDILPQPSTSCETLEILLCLSEPIFFLNTGILFK